MPDITLWKPEPDLILHQALGKLAEEIGELNTIVARILIQGADGRDPKTGKPNAEALQEEITDVLSAATWLQQLGHGAVLTDRANRKLQGYLEWQAMLEADRDGTAANEYGAPCDEAPLQEPAVHG
ncbi:uncharacterized protein YihD (DUF1040 family) [Neorhizobium galegae]|uniref:hypothetical protein n=1 Tax=Neorhizobium galegae TaxID=399 RepID=UPI001AE28666|nr:hypothetical protein [Neorhizobium galegae]MBP2560814.1 uncharacterized protein YihD (DUF1040 family) [Neorhizobium galegae]